MRKLCGDENIQLRTVLGQQYGHVRALLTGSQRAVRQPHIVLDIDMSA